MMIKTAFAVLALCLAGGVAAQTPPPTSPAPAAATPSPPAPPTRARNPRPINPGSWIAQDDYPVGAQANGQQGTVGFQVQVNTEGLVTGCTITASSGWPLLDEFTCRLISERARFTAALDARGRPTAGSYRNRIQWRLPPPQPTPPTAPAPAQ
jgi:periplasmic protein TonB